MLIAGLPTPCTAGVDPSAHESMERHHKRILAMKIFIPTPLRVYVNKQDAVQVKAQTVGDALQALTSEHPDLRKHLYSDEGKLRAFVNVYLNDEDVRYLPEKEATTVTERDSLSIIPSIAGGC